jgi:hypothetical protein
MILEKLLQKEFYLIVVKGGPGGPGGIPQGVRGLGLTWPEFSAILGGAAGLYISQP